MTTIKACLGVFVLTSLAAFGLASLWKGCDQRDLRSEIRQLREKLSERDARYIDKENAMQREIADRTNKTGELTKARNVCDGHGDGPVLVPKTQTGRVRHRPLL
jgi:hypothetical protein